MKTIKTFLAIAFSIGLLSCHKNSSNLEIPVGDYVQEDQAKSKSISGNLYSAQNTDSVAGPDVYQAGQPGKHVDWDKQIIKTANVRLEIKDYAAYDKILHGSLKRYGAYVAGEQQVESDYRIENRLTIKVPVAFFDEVMAILPGDGGKVIEKNISTEDVTGEVVDTKARIEAKKQIRNRYLNLLKQAKNIKEILEVQQVVDGIQEDIEAGTGRVEYLVKQSAYSTINVTYFQIIQAGGTINETPSFITKIREAFSDGSEIIKGFILILITFWPIIIIGLIAWYFIKKRGGKLTFKFSAKP